MKLQVTITLTLLLLVSSITGQEQPLSLRQEAVLDSLATVDVPAGAPGIAAGVVIDGEIVYRKYAGFANLKDSVRIDEASRFNIASNGKQFTALAVLRLIEAGQLDLKDDIRKFFPELYPGLSSPILVEHLLRHSSGIRDVYDLWGLQGLTWWKEKLSNTDAMVLLRQQEELNFEPGTAYLYSNSNYILLAEIVGKVSGQSFVAYTDDLFQSLGMPHTSFVADYRNIRGPIARPYFNFDRWFDYEWTCNLHGDGNLFSTLEDQLRWEQILQGGTCELLSPELITRSQEHIDGYPDWKYGYGLEFGQYRGVNYRFHEGGTGAWKATTIRFPAAKMAIVTLSNSGKTTTDRQTRTMADYLLGLRSDTRSFPLEPAQAGDYLELHAIIGTYLINNTSFQLEDREGELFLIRSGRNDIRLLREADNIFHQWNDPTFKQEFRRNDAGEMELTAYHTSHAPYTLVRPESDWSEFDPASLNGQYVNREINTTFTLQHDAGRSYIVKNSRQKIRGLLITPDRLLAGSYGIELRRDADGRISELFLAGDRIRRVRFVRSGE